MFATRLNELRVSLELIPIGPLLIKEGRHLATEKGPSREHGKVEIHKERHIVEHRLPREPQRKDLKGAQRDYGHRDGTFDMACVHSTTSEGDRFYLPGSSLRGVLRSAAERLVGRWQPEWTQASDPFTNRAEAWVRAERREHRPPDGAAIYAHAGPIERCFGHTALRGRWTVEDAWIKDEQSLRVLVRDGVGIDRATGAARESVKYQFEALISGEHEAVFCTTLTLVNYELWQLGLLAHLLAALDMGELRLGYGTRRGLGRVRVRVSELAFRWFPPKAQQSVNGTIPSLSHLWALAGKPEHATAYALRDSDLRLALPTRKADQDTLPVLEADPKRTLPVPTWVVRPPKPPSPLQPNSAEDLAAYWDNKAFWPLLGVLLAQTLTDWPSPPVIAPPSDATAPALPSEGTNL